MKIKKNGFSQLLIGTAVYGCGDGAIVLGGTINGPASFNGGIGETMVRSTDWMGENVRDYYVGGI